MDFLIFVISIAILVSGADMIIRSSNALALKFNIAHFVVGASLVALGASLPEMGVALIAHAEAKPQMAMATLIGSAILNLTLIFGSIFIFARSIKIEQNFFKQDALWLLAGMALFILSMVDKNISYFEAVVLILFYISYLLFLVNNTQKSHTALTQITLHPSLNLMSATVLLVMGGVLLIIGSIFTVDSVTNIASRFGLDEWHSGMIMIALATALPELILSILAVYKNHAEIAIANILGSTLSNLTLIVALMAMMHPLSFDLTMHWYDFIVMLTSALIVSAVILTHNYNRYIIFTLFLILALFIEQLPL
jgi:cation:H+ antiporter